MTKSATSGLFKKFISLNNKNKNYQKIAAPPANQMMELYVEMAIIYLQIQVPGADLMMWIFVI